jgi:hypothetical protein
MSARTADVQIYNINYLRNISGAGAVSYTPVQNVCQRQSAHAPQYSSFSFIADPGNISTKNKKAAKISSGL